MPQGVEHMPELRAIPLDLLDPPDKPMRIDTTFEGLSDLKESLAQNGLINPVTARQAGERYQLIAGVRRSLAARELGWKTIEARVYAEGEPCNVDEIMAHENFHRTQINAVEEALYHAEQIAKHGISVAEEARRSRRSPDTV